MKTDDILVEILLLEDEDRNRLLKQLSALLTTMEKVKMMKDVRWNDDNYWDKLL